jgi:hypothetical protein
MTVDRPVDRVIDLTDKWSQIALREIVRIGESYEDEWKWATADELSWSVFQATECIRGRTRAVLRELAANGVLEVFLVHHRQQMMDCYLLDAEALRRIGELLVS